MSHPSTELDMTRFVVVLQQPLPAFNALRGDCVVVRLGHYEPVMVIRKVPADYGSILLALERGAATPLNNERTTEQLTGMLRALLGDTPPKPRGRRKGPTPAYGVLTLVRGGAK